MNDLSSLFAGLVRHHLATPDAPLPEPRAGITWIVAANGVFKRGIDQHRDLLIRVGPLGTPVPGLVSLLPHARWPSYSRRLPGQFLHAMLLHARKAAVPLQGALVQPIEQQYHVIWECGALRVRVPEQNATPGRVVYEMPDGPVLCDLHSHHAMPAFYSNTDTHDDSGLSISLVMGTIFTQPTLVARLNVYGHRQPIAPDLIFDDISPFTAVLPRQRQEHAYAVAYD